MQASQHMLWILAFLPSPDQFEGSETRDRYEPWLDISNICSQNVCCAQFIQFAVSMSIINSASRLTSPPTSSYCPHSLILQHNATNNATVIRTNCPQLPSYRNMEYQPAPECPSKNKIIIPPRKSIPFNVIKRVQ